MPISLKNTASVLPYIRYSPQANAMMLAGEDNKPREIEFLGKSFAIDIENGTMGWLLIGAGVRDWQPFPINSVPPPSPGSDYKRGFSTLFYAPKLLGSPEAHEMTSATGAVLSFCERLFNEAEPNFGKGDVPIVKITEAEAITIGKGKSRELHFEIIKWISRPKAIIEALAKLKASTNTPPNKDAAAGAGAADNEGDDFDEDVTAPSKEEPAADKSEKSTTEKSKSRAKKAQPDSSDILDDPIPY